MTWLAVKYVVYASLVPSDRRKDFDSADGANCARAITVYLETGEQISR